MEVQLQTFAILKDHFGANIPLSLPENATVNDIYLRLNQQYPEKQAVWKRCRIAINNQFAASHTPVKASDVLFIMPPSSGG